MIKIEFEGLIRWCKFYLYVVIFNEEGIEKKWRKEKKRGEEKKVSQEGQKRDVY